MLLEKDVLEINNKQGKHPKEVPKHKQHSESVRVYYDQNQTNLLRRQTRQLYIVQCHSY